jgi:hypothetical protein
MISVLVIETHLQVLGSDVALSGQQHLYVLRCGIENWGKVGRSHFEEILVGDEKL